MHVKGGGAFQMHRQAEKTEEMHGHPDSGSHEGLILMHMCLISNPFFLS
jgi:hypothetical protein